MNGAGESAQSDVSRISKCEAPTGAKGVADFVREDSVEKLPVASSKWSRRIDALAAGAVFQMPKKKRNGWKINLKIVICR